MSHDPSTTDSFVARMPFRNLGTINLAAGIGRGMKAALRHWQKQRAIRTLQALDDWTLNDIGLARNDIRRVVNDLVTDPSPRTGRGSGRRRDPEGGTRPGPSGAWASGRQGA